MRVLGGLVSTRFIVMVIFSFLSIIQMPIDVVISGIIFIFAITPVCIYGYIPALPQDT